MKTRITSAAVLIVVTLTCVTLSVYTRVIFFAAAGILSAYELCKNMKSELHIHISSFALYVYLGGQLILTLLQAAGLLKNGIYFFAVWFVLCVYLAMVGGILRKNVSGEGAMYTVAGLTYPCLLFTLLMDISTTDIWVESLLIGCVAVWVCDTFALLGGMKFGKHKCAPLVSPHKTWEGCLCGAASSILSGIVLWAILRTSSGLSLGVCVVTSLLASTMGQFGDLSESLLKRMIGIKDFSNLIPGHGGMFDRADSLLFGIPTAYFCLKVFAQIF